MSEIYAVFVRDDVGNDFDIEQSKVLQLNYKYKVTNANIGQSSSSIHLEGFNEIVSFNSIHFDFEDEKGNSIDLLKTKYNSYISTHNNLDILHELTRLIIDIEGIRDNLCDNVLNEKEAKQLLLKLLLKQLLIIESEK